jgi:hypothetical protein
MALGEVRPVGEVIEDMKTSVKHQETRVEATNPVSDIATKFSDRNSVVLDPKDKVAPIPIEINNASMKRQNFGIVTIMVKAIPEDERGFKTNIVGIEEMQRSEVIGEGEWR